MELSPKEQQPKQNPKPFRGMKSLPTQNQSPKAEKVVFMSARKKKPMLNAGELTFKKSPRNSDLSFLNFRFPERQADFQRHTPRFRGDQLAFNKDRFVNANFRFIVDPSVELSLEDPDTIIKWDYVDQLVVPTSSPSCPICLSVPVAPRSSKCGHLFCMPCILHYISLSDHSWRKCPICFESIYPSALKPVVFLTSAEIETPTLDTPITHEFTLVRREAGSTIALPIISFRKWKTRLPNVDVISAIEFAKFSTSTPEYLKNSFQKDIDSLALSLDSADIGSYEPTFIQTSIDAIKIAQEKVSPEQVSPRHLPNPDSIYFYQSSDGLHTYLHPLDIKILKHEFKSYDAFPSTLSVEVIKVSESSITTAVRKRLKYLAHLPLTCKVLICETRLEGVVSQETLKVFEKEIEERDRRIRREESKSTAEKIVESVTMDLHEGLTLEEFVYQQEDFVPLSKSLSSSPSESVLLERSFAKAATSMAPKSLPGWDIDLSDDVISQVKSGERFVKGEKKKKKGVLLFGNSSSRARS